MNMKDFIYKNNNEIYELNITKLLLTTIIFALFHSLYLINTQEKRINNIKTISLKEATKQKIINRFIVLIVTFMFLIIEINKLYSCNDIIKQKARIAVVSFAFISLLLDVLLSLNDYNTL